MSQHEPYCYSRGDAIAGGMLVKRKAGDERHEY